MTEFSQLLLAGLSLGAMYALIALGFVIVYKATGILNFAQGGLLMIGAYLAYHVINRWSVPFPIALPIAMLATGLLGVVIQHLLIARLIGKPAFTAIMVTCALQVVLEQVPPAIWGYDFLTLGDPWGLSMVSWGSLAAFTIDVWALAFAAGVVAMLFLFFRYSRLGIAMRAIAADPEAALAQGISARLVFALAWFIAGAVAALAGSMLGGGARVVSPELSLVALRAFPAIILGGLDSPAGAVLGGMTIGVAEVLTANYAPAVAPWLGQNFHLVMPYLVLVAILVVRPYGLFGTQAVRRM